MVGAGALTLCGEAKRVEFVQPGEGKASGACSASGASKCGNEYREVHY